MPIRPAYRIDGYKLEFQNRCTREIYLAYKHRRD